MKTLLRIDASAQRAESHSRRLADHYEARWRAMWPEGCVITRDLVATPLPHMHPAMAEVFYAESQSSAPDGDLPLSDEMIDELLAADAVVVSSAVYNFGIPSALKAWVDHVVRFGRTIEWRDRSVVGRLGGKSACLLVARGGFASMSPEYLTPTMQAVFGYMGISQVDVICLEGTRVRDGNLESRIAKVREEVDALFSVRRSPVVSVVP